MNLYNIIFLRFDGITLFIVGDYEENELILNSILGTFKHVL